MDKIIDKIAALPADGEYLSLEFFPPKTAMGFTNLRHRLHRMEKALKPLFVNVTWGAGGSTATKSLQLAELCQRDLGLTTCLHLTCTNMSRRLIDKALEDAKVLGIRNILALRGDPPRDDEYRDTNGPGDDTSEDFTRAVDLVRYIRKKHLDYFCIGVAAYPEGHADESHPRGQSLEHDLPHLIDKVQAGADFIMTQLFFDIDAYDHFEKTLRDHSSRAFESIPLIPGLMPIHSYQMVTRTAKLCHARMPDAIMARIDAVKGDDELVKDVGVEVIGELVDQIRTIKSRTAGPRGFHFYTMNLEKAVSLIVERTGLIPEGSEGSEHDESVLDDTSLAPPPVHTNGHRASSYSRASRRRSSVGSDAYNRVIVSGRPATHPEWEATGQEAGAPSRNITSRANTLAISEGEGVLGREATWDDFPNGRFGDSRSPAYGEVDGYGVSLHMSVTQAVTLWGHPKTHQDINNIFVKHIKGEISAIPWSEEGLSAESSTIESRLLRMNSKGWLTVASQPAVNSIPSSDGMFGWGPKNGFVFQKAFAEFFLPSADWAALYNRLRESKDRDVFCFYAANGRGDLTSSDTLAAAAVSSRAVTPSTNAVTWGVFPGKEIVTPTIIEEISFKAWSEEAFSIWGEWAKVYGRGSDSEKLLRGIRDDYWLVNIIHHDFIHKDALWDLLLE